MPAMANSHRGVSFARRAVARSAGAASLKGGGRSRLLGLGENRSSQVRRRVGPDQRFSWSVVPFSNRASCVGFRSGLPAKRSHASPTRGVPLHTAQAKLCRGHARRCHRARTSAASRSTSLRPRNADAHARGLRLAFGTTTRPAPGVRGSSDRGRRGRVRCAVSS